MAFRYDFVILDRITHKFITAINEANSFVEAFSNVFRENKKLWPNRLDVYAKRKNGDLQYMATFEGGTTYSGGSPTAWILKLTNGEVYHWTGTENGFRKDY